MCWNDHGLLCARVCGNPEPVYTWSYSDFERFLNECITPSIYRSMSRHVTECISDQALVSIQNGEYVSDGIEAEAVDVYFDLPIKTRIDLHVQELRNLETLKKVAEDKFMAATNYLLSDESPFDTTSPIYHELVEHMRKLAAKYRDESLRLENEYCEESQWVGGHELGAEDILTWPVY